MATTPKPNRVLVDRSVVSDAIVGQWVNAEHTVNWGGRAVKANVVGMRLKARLRPDQKDRQLEIDALPTIAKLARNGELELATYDELRFEEFVAETPVRGTLGDLFAGVDFARLEPAVDRSYFQGLEFSAFVDGTSATDFCKVLLSPKFDPVMLPPEFVHKLPAVSKESLEQLDHFRALCRHAQEGHYRDLFHLWTAQVNGCAAFLTMEKKLPNFCRSNVKVPHCPVLRPRQLLETLQVPLAEPMPIAPGEVVDYFRATDIPGETKS